MEFFLRPDAVYALDLPGVNRALGRYVKVVRDELPAKFQIAKKVAVEFDPKASEKELWKIHGKALKDYRKLEKKIDAGKLKLERVKKPEQSFLDLKCAIADKIMTHCHFCHRRCGVNRLKGEVGFCKAGTEWRIFGAHGHMGEEGCLVVSGTVFNSACTMRCVYCCNGPESIEPELGQVWRVEEVVRWMEGAKKQNMRNISHVGGTPTCWLWHILKALQLCKANIAQVWNDNAYYSPETAKLIDGVMDVYLLDFRYMSEECARKLSSAPDYPKVAARNHLYAKKAGELLVRLLVIPGHLECDAKRIVKWVEENLGPWTRFNILAQYGPRWKAGEYEHINRPLSHSEWVDVVSYARKIGLKNLEKG